MGEPALSLSYKVTIDGIIPLGTWSKIEGLGFAFDVTEYREGGGRGSHDLEPLRRRAGEVAGSIA